MENILKLTEIDFTSFFITAFVIAFGVKSGLEILAYFIKKFGIKTVSDREKEKLENRLQKLEEHDDWQYEAINKINDGIERLSERLLDKTISDYRHDILDMASAISLGRNYSKEQIEYIIHVDEAYQKILKDNGLQNGQVEMSMQVINEKYKDGLLNGFGNMD